MDPGVWGPSAWALVHAVAENVKTRNVGAVHKWFATFDRVLPCPKCQRSYVEHIRLLPIPTVPGEFGRWAYELHNRVNITKRVPLREWPSYEVVSEVKLGEGRLKRLNNLRGENVWVFLNAVALICSCTRDFWLLLPDVLDTFAHQEAIAIKEFVKRNPIDKKNMVAWVQRMAGGTHMALTAKCDTVCSA